MATKKAAKRPPFKTVAFLQPIYKQMGQLMFYSATWWLQFETNFETTCFGCIIFTPKIYPYLLVFSDFLPYSFKFEKNGTCFALAKLQRNLRTFLFNNLCDGGE